jgi:glutathione S-transferase
MIKLYSGPLSLYSRKVEIALHEKGLSFERELVAFSQTQGYRPKHPAVLAANPKGQVPVLVDQGVAIYDSTVILDYLEDAYPHPPLFPREAADRARCRLFDVYADEVTIVPLRALMHRTEPHDDDAPNWLAAEAKTAAAEMALAAHFAELDGKLDGKLDGEPYLCRDFSIADIAVFMAVFFSQRLGGPPLDRHPNLFAWYGRLCARPAFAQVVTEIIAADQELSAPVANAYGGRPPPGC